ncbi:hypothetical protein GCM10007298_09570 [Williamsia phyllosphaerae]|uniref:Enoyl-CoA hydratase n=2 Tax=Williamsia phyllosphaerae TaxID=885042 RepID=A0ABQ1UCX8_9NOCA|nr:hypothetical protein GCM10007298_09570 [Williamsia phyllosphaerae]
MRTYFRSFVAAAAVAAAMVTGGFATAAPAAAAPREKPVQGVTLYSNTVATFGDHDFCRGSANARYTSPKRGVLRLTLTSNGFIGNGAGWKKNPKCRVLFIASQVSSVSLLGETFIPATFGSKPGQKITRDVRTGSGLVQFGLAPYSANSPVRVLQGSGFTSYLLVP